MKIIMGFRLIQDFLNRKMVQDRIALLLGQQGLLDSSLFLLFPENLQKPVIIILGQDKAVSFSINRGKKSPNLVPSPIPSPQEREAFRRVGGKTLLVTKFPPLFLSYRLIEFVCFNMDQSSLNNYW